MMMGDDVLPYRCKANVRRQPRAIAQGPARDHNLSAQMTMLMIMLLMVMTVMTVMMMEVERCLTEEERSSRSSSSSSSRRKLETGKKAKRAKKAKKEKKAVQGTRAGSTATAVLSCTVRGVAYRTARRARGSSRKSGPGVPPYCIKDETPKGPITAAGQRQATSTFCHWPCDPFFPSIFLSFPRPTPHAHVRANAAHTSTAHEKHSPSTKTAAAGNGSSSSSSNNSDKQLSWSSPLNTVFGQRQWPVSTARRSRTE